LIPRPLAAGSFILSSFMGGLILGAWLVTRFSGRIKNHLSVFIRTQIAICLYPLILPVFFRWLSAKYLRSLHGLLEHPPVMLLFAAVVLVSTWFMFTTSKSELAPTEDQEAGRVLRLDIRHLEEINPHRIPGPLGGK